MTDIAAQPSASNEPEFHRPLPAWISIILIILCLGAGGWIMHWYVTTDPLSHESKILDAAAYPVVMAQPQQQRPFRNNRQIDNTPPIRQQDNNWFIRAPEATMHVVAAPGKPVVVQSIYYNSNDFVPRDEIAIISAARTIFRQDEMVKQLKMTPDQVQQLNQLRSAIGMMVEPADNDRLVSLFKEYRTATDKAAAQAKMFAAMGDIAGKSLDATRKAADERAKKVKAVLTDQQWKQFNAIGK